MEINNHFYLNLGSVSATQFAADSDNVHFIRVNEAPQ